ncbi:hypothetical protein BKI52_19225 [marine bacterium AO1-C]|nr:hypothetical protein BKI52_19225 [marine bacterium AO1-C]
MTYELNLIIDPYDLPLLLAAHMKLTIARQIGSDAPQVIWQAFEPLEANQVAWENEYGVYASKQYQERDGVIIIAFTNHFPAKDNTLNTLNANGTFTESATQASGVGMYAVANHMPYDRYPALTFGLEQKIIVNGRQIPPCPINAALVPLQSDAQFTPQNMVYVWMQAPYESGTIVGHAFEHWTKVVFTEGTYRHTLKYNHNTGMFEIVNQ